MFSQTPTPVDIDHGWCVKTRRLVFGSNDASDIFMLLAWVFIKFLRCTLTAVQMLFSVHLGHFGAFKNFSCIISTGPFRGTISRRPLTPSNARNGWNILYLIEGSWSEPSYNLCLSCMRNPLPVKVNFCRFRSWNPAWNLEFWTFLHGVSSIQYDWAGISS